MAKDVDCPEDWDSLTELFPDIFHTGDEEGDDHDGPKSALWYLKIQEFTSKGDTVKIDTQGLTNWLVDMVGTSRMPTKKTEIHQAGYRAGQFAIYNVSPHGTRQRALPMLTNQKSTYKARIPVPLDDHAAYQLVVVNPDGAMKLEAIKKYVDMIIDDQTR